MNWENAKSKIQKIYHDQRGAALLLFVAVFIPLIVLMLIGLFRTGNLSSLGDDSFQQAVDEATRGAAMRIDPISNARGNRRIAYNYAKETFLGELSASLPMSTDSPIKKVTYWMIVFNGDSPYGDFEGYKILPYYYCDNVGGVEKEDLQSEPSGALKVKVTEQGIKSESDPAQGKIVDLKSPGVIAVVSIELENMNSGKLSRVNRWSYHVIDEFP